MMGNVLFTAIILFLCSEYVIALLNKIRYYVYVINVRFE